MLFLNNYIFKNKIFYIFITFIFSRIFYYEFFDITFDSWTVDVYWQFIPQELLKNNFIESIIYNHWQAPFLNLLLGLLMKLTNEYFLILHLSYLFFGLCSFLLIYLICKNFDFSEKASFIVSFTL